MQPYVDLMLEDKKLVELRTDEANSIYTKLLKMRKNQVLFDYLYYINYFKERR